MKSYLRLAAVCASFALVAGCGSNSADSTKSDTTDAPAVEDSTAAAPAPEYFGLEYPASSTSAKAGETILAPSRAFVDQAITEGNDNTSFIYYNATMGTPGETTSSINTIFDTGISMPNALIVPIPAKQTAAVGDVVLTWWQSGSGMQRAIVVAGGTPEQPMVRYLDIDLDNPATNDEGTPLAESEEQLAKDSFYVLTSDFQVGTGVAYPGPYGDYGYGQIVNVSGDKILVLGWAGSLEVIDKSTAIALPVKPDFKVGDAVYIDAYGSFTNGVVTKVDAPHGRVYVEYDFAGDKETVGAPFGSVAAGDAF